MRGLALVHEGRESVDLGFTFTVTPIRQRASEPTRQGVATTENGRWTPLYAANPRR